MHGTTRIVGANVSFFLCFFFCLSKLKQATSNPQSDGDDRRCLFYPDLKQRFQVVSSSLILFFSFLFGDATMLRDVFASSRAFFFPALTSDVALPLPFLDS